MSGLGSTKTVSRREVLRITAVAGLAGVLGVGAGRAWLRALTLQRASETRVHLGTSVTLEVHHPDAEGARVILERGFSELERLEGILSRHRPGTPVAQLSREGRLEAPPPELVEVLERSIEISRASLGAFDVTVAPLLALFQRVGAEGRLPSDEERAEALDRVDHRALHITPEAVWFDRPGMALTLDGIAKGYVIDGVVKVLRGAGAERVLVEAGGDLATGSEAAGEAPREIAIRDPLHPDRSLGTLPLLRGGVASSGDYVQAWSADRSIHHLIDPRTGRSPAHLRGVTVTAPNGMDADALSTAAFVLGPREGLAFLEGWRGAEGLLVDAEGRRLRTSGFVLRG